MDNSIYLSIMESSSHFYSIFDKIDSIYQAMSTIQTYLNQGKINNNSCLFCSSSNCFSLQNIELLPFILHKLNLFTFRFLERTLKKNQIPYVQLIDAWLFFLIQPPINNYNEMGAVRKDIYMWLGNILCDFT